ncbi:MAG: phenylalanine--tRNA ligase subunit beta [Candidatus Kaelpia aquatica]|nr:phenylalanine--tRNA ligase subunit beta [Candidatus Kaelpia aquatica]
MKVLLSWLKDFIDIDVSVKELSASLTMIGLEVTSVDKIEEDDYLLDIEVTPNRPDCLSVLGLAREVGLALDKRAKHPRVVFLPRTSVACIKEAGFDITIEDGNACPRYIGRVLLGVRVQPAPDFIKDRLQNMGVRSINNVVDITNYLLLELGQPMHAFDYDKIKDHKIVVRKARKNEKIVTIDGVERELNTEDLVIADSKQPVALAGIMGGLATEVTAKTKNVLLESAYFDPPLIRRTAQRHGLMTESSYRFERGVDFVMVDTASKCAVDLIRKHASDNSLTNPTVVIDKAKDLIKKQLPLSSKVVLKFEDIEKKIGILPSSFWIRKTIKNLGCEPLSISKNMIKIEAPSYRRDLSSSIDYIEEIARLYGYDNIPVQELSTLELSSEEKLKEFNSGDLTNKVKDYLVREGLHETISYALLSKDEAARLDFPNMIFLDNPLVKSYSVLRPSIMPSLLKTAEYNFNRMNYNLALFESGKTYSYAQQESDELEGLKEPREIKAAAILLSGIKYRNCFGQELKHTFFDLKTIIERILNNFGIRDYNITTDQNHLYADSCSAKIMLGNDKIASLGKVSDEIKDYYGLKREVYIGEIVLDLVERFQKDDSKYKEISQYPAIERDISLVLSKSIAVAEVLFKIKDRDDLIQNVEIIDIYEGKQVGLGKKSIAVRIKFQSLERTLKDEEVDRIEAGIKDVLCAELSCQIRE